MAMTRKRVIGKNNQIPWRLRGELKWFKEVTMGHSILMGRKTFESIGKPLPGRRNLVVTRAGNFAGVDLVRDLKTFDPALYEADGKEIFVIGGAEVYGALLDRCDTIYMTIVKQEYDRRRLFSGVRVSIRNLGNDSGNSGIRHFLFPSPALIRGSCVGRAGKTLFADTFPPTYHAVPV